MAPDVRWDFAEFDPRTAVPDGDEPRGDVPRFAWSARIMHHITPDIGIVSVESPYRAFLDCMWSIVLYYGAV